MDLLTTVFPLTSGLTAECGGGEGAGGCLNSLMPNCPDLTEWALLVLARDDRKLQHLKGTPQKALCRNKDANPGHRGHGEQCICRLIDALVDIVGGALSVLLSGTRGFASSFQASGMRQVG